MLPSLAVNIYIIASSDCPSVCPGLVGRTVSPRIGTSDQHSEKKMLSSMILQLSTIDYHDERKMPFVFQGQRSKVKVVLSHSRKTLLAGYRINRMLQDHTN